MSNVHHVLSALMIVSMLMIMSTTVYCQSYGVVTKQVINLRNAPIDMPVPIQYNVSDPYQESQLVFQECVKIVNRTSDGQWLYVNAMHQPTFISGSLTEYPGYIRTSEVQPIDHSCVIDTKVNKYVIMSENLVNLYDSETSQIVLKLSIGTILSYTSRNDRVTVVQYYANNKLSTGFVETMNCNVFGEPLSDATKLIQVGKKLLGWPYAWGGRSSFHYEPNVFTGVDCSGFVSFVYMVALNMVLPRNANDQYVIARNVTGGVNSWQVGDLLFLGKLDQVRMTHVMLYVGNGYLMESSESTRYMKVTQRLSVKSLDDLCYGCEVYDRGVYKRFYYGRILQE